MDLLPHSHRFVLSRYRVLAFDHDLLSFSDLRFEQWPVVVITNPKNAQYLHPGVEPLGRIQRSTHIRCVLYLIYSHSSFFLEYWSVEFRNGANTSVVGRLG